MPQVLALPLRCQEETMTDLPYLQSFCVLYVEDDEVVLKNMEQVLTVFFKEVYVCNNGIDAIDLYEEHLPDLLITDIKMADFSGLELIATLKERFYSNAYMAITSAHAEQEYLLNAIHSGVDRYIIKPVGQQALMELFEDFLKKKKSSQQLRLEVSQGITYDQTKRMLTVYEKQYALNDKESRLLTLLNVDPYRIYTYEEIEYQVWGKRSMSLAALRSVVRDLRKKLGKTYIYNVSKQGYRLLEQTERVN